MRREPVRGFAAVPELASSSRFDFASFQGIVSTFLACVSHRAICWPLGLLLWRARVRCDSGSRQNGSPSEARWRP
eukprot:9483194-Pyramimonas_sp.AAC.1